MDRVRVVIAEDNLFVREGICRVLEQDPAIDTVAVCGSLPELLAAVDQFAPDLVLTDIRMPPTATDEGIRGARQLRETHPHIGVVVLSQYVEPVYALALLDEGANRRGYLLKESVGAPNQLINAIRTVASGGSSIDPLVVDSLISARRRRATPIDTLTARETDIIAEVASGKNNAAISTALGVSERVVEKHINSIFAKLNLHDDHSTHRRVRAVLMYLANRGQ